MEIKFNVEDTATIISIYLESTFPNFEQKGTLHVNANAETENMEDLLFLADLEMKKERSCGKSSK